jgi:hypothetical protein
MEHKRLNHCTPAQWKEAWEEPEDSIHPCNHWRATQCDCKGACSCHWVENKESWYISLLHENNLDLEIAGYSHPGWYFWDETHSLHGPFNTIDEVESYADTYLSNC